MHGMKSFLTFALAAIFGNLSAQEKTLHFEGKIGPGKGKHIVLVVQRDRRRVYVAIPRP